MKTPSPVKVKTPTPFSPISPQKVPTEESPSAEVVQMDDDSSSEEEQQNLEFSVISRKLDDEMR